MTVTYISKFVIRNGYIKKTSESIIETNSRSPITTIKKIKTNEIKINFTKDLTNNTITTKFETEEYMSTGIEKGVNYAIKRDIIGNWDNNFL